QLLLHKTIKGLVLVERPKDIVPVAVSQRSITVGTKVAVGVRIAGSVEPVFAPALAVVGRTQSAFDHALIGSRRVVCQESIDLGRRGRKARQIEAHPADEGGPIGGRIKGKLFLLQGSTDKLIDGCLAKSPLADRGHRRPNRDTKRP